MPPWASCSWLASLSAAYYAGVAAAAAHFAWQLRSFDGAEATECMAKFVSNKWLGAIVFAAILAGKSITPFL
jgi:4-hydroxybenzoate polyprenyltransferase